MEEKVLIKSYVAKGAKNFMLGCMGVLFGLAIIIFISLGQETNESGYWSRYTRTGYEAAFGGDGAMLAYFIFACVFAVLGIIMLIIFLATMKCELTITEKNVKGRALFGKEVVLPLYMISAFSTRKLLATIAVATSSGMTKFSLIGNYSEISQILSQLINNRQRDTVTAAPATATAQSSAMDDLVKLKSLLDQGIITQEEFNAKKNQLLGL
jgi:preprotein translocase subunit SecY